MHFMRKLAALALLGAAVVAAQDRIIGPIDPSRRAVLWGHVHPMARAEYDQGPADPSMELGYVTLLLNPAPALDVFLAEQQNPSSPNYHK
jgi:hypothetical protein